MPTLLATNIQMHSTRHVLKKVHNDAKKRVLMPGRTPQHVLLARAVGAEVL